MFLLTIEKLSAVELEANSAHLLEQPSAKKGCFPTLNSILPGLAALCKPGCLDLMSCSTNC